MTQQIAQNNISIEVASRIEHMETSGEIHMPENYSFQNALKSAWLILQDTKDANKKPVLESCTRESIANALLNMVIQGLNPSKHQGYFIAYGNQLTFQRSYLGTIAITKRIEGVKDVQGFALYKDDTFKMGFDFSKGTQMVKEYEPNVSEWKPENLIGAFAIIIGNDSLLHTEYMTLAQIKQAWNMGQTKGGSKAHTGFSDQMAIKTVINRACKRYVDTRDDSDLMLIMTQQTDAEVQEEIALNANTEMLPDYTDYDVDPDTGEILDFDQPPSAKAPF